MKPIIPAIVCALSLTLAACERHETPTVSYDPKYDGITANSLSSGAVNSSILDPQARPAAPAAASAPARAATQPATETTPAIEATPG